MLDRFVDVLADVGERDDLVALAAIAAPSSPSSAAASSMFVAAAVFGMEARAELEQRADRGR